MAPARPCAFTGGCHVFCSKGNHVRPLALFLWLNQLLLSTVVCVCCHLNFFCCKFLEVVQSVGLMTLMTWQSSGQLWLTVNDDSNIRGFKALYVGKVENRKEAILIGLGGGAGSSVLFFFFFLSENDELIRNAGDGGGGGVGECAEFQRLLLPLHSIFSHFFA